MKGGRFFEVAGGKAEGDWKHLSSIASHQQMNPPSPDSTGPKISAYFNVNLVEIKCCERALDL
jgi:hypothetical protein